MLWLKLLKLCWIVVVTVSTLILFLTIGETLLLFHQWRYACCDIIRFIIYGFYYVEVCSSYACFLEGFYHKCMLNFVKGLFCNYWNNHMIFIFQLVNVVYHIDWFANILESLHPWDKAHLVMMYDLFNILLDSVF